MYIIVNPSVLLPIFVQFEFSLECPISSLFDKAHCKGLLASRVVSGLCSSILGHSVLLMTSKWRPPWRHCLIMIDCRAFWKFP